MILSISLTILLQKTSVCRRLWMNVVFSRDWWTNRSCFLKRWVTRRSRNSDVFSRWVWVSTSRERRRCIFETSISNRINISCLCRICFRCCRSRISWTLFSTSLRKTLQYRKMKKSRRCVCAFRVIDQSFCVNRSKLEKLKEWNCESELKCWKQNCVENWI